MAKFDNPFYPYQKVYGGFYDLSSTVDIPSKIMDYICDMPDGNGYAPVDDNMRARVRLWKYLYHDGAQPLSKALPTSEEKKSVLFNPEEPENAPTGKGYRLFPQRWVKQSQTAAQTRIYVYMGRTIAENDINIQLSVAFDIWSHYTEEANTKETDAYSRVFAIEQCIIEAFHGVNMAGVGSFYFDRTQHADCGSTPIVDDNSNVGRHLVLGLQVSSETRNNTSAYAENGWG